jgi:hypothetical protein
MTGGWVARQETSAQHITDVVSIPKRRPVAEGMMIPLLLCGSYCTGSQEFIVIIV